MMAKLTLRASLMLVIALCDLPAEIESFAPEVLQVAQKRCARRRFSILRPTSSARFGIQNVVDAVDETASNTREEANKASDTFIVESLENESPAAFAESTEEIHHNQVGNLALSKEAFSGPLPFSLVVDQVAIKQALILAASNPQGLGAKGVLIYGGKGTAKSVLARSVQHLLPSTIRRVKGSMYNIDPEGSVLDSLLENEILENNTSILDLECEVIETPFVTIPLSCQEDSLLGTVDLEKSLIYGSTIFEPGLLARAHRGILYIDDINLLDEGLVHILLNALTDGFVIVEREGLSVRYPCQPCMVLASFNPEEGELREHWMDRMAMAVPSGIDDLMVDDRVEVVENIEGFQDKTLSSTSMEIALREDKSIKKAISAAKELLPQVQMSSEQLHYLCEEATRAECEGQRAEIFAAEIAKTSAALGARTKVNAQDLQRAVLLAIAPRSQVAYYMAPQDQLQNLVNPPPPEITPPETENEEEIEEEENEQEMETEKENETEQEEEEEVEEPDSDEDLQIPTTFMFGVDKVPIDPRLMKFHKRTRKGKGGKRAKIFNILRGRFVKAVFPKGKDWKKGHIAVGATLRAAAPFQIVRRTYSKDKNKLIYIRDSDFRIKRMSRKAGSLIIFVVDASGSMALNRMGAAKGAAMALLMEAYKSRDKICLIEFHGARADTIVPPTKSSTLTKRRLEGMPCGGESPLAHALVTAIRTGMNALKVKKDIGRVVVVLLTDGRGNVPLCVSEGQAFDPSVDKNSVEGEPSREYLRDEVLAIGKQLGTLKDFNFLVVDTEDKFVGTGVGKELAKVALGNYFHLLVTDARKVAAITRSGMENSAT